MVQKLILKIKNWWILRKLTKEFDKEVDQNVNMWSNRDVISEIQDDQDVQQKYYNGIVLMKRRIKERLAEDYSISAFGAAFGGDDLLTLAESESAEKLYLAKTLKKAYVYEGTDVKDNDDKIKMIDKRIHDYIELQRDKEERQLVRKIRQAYKDGDTKLHDTLTLEWKKKYGKSRNSKTRH